MSCVGILCCKGGCRRDEREGLLVADPSKTIFLGKEE